MPLYAHTADDLDPIDRVLPKLQRVKKCGKGWSARCPAHKDSKPSLTVAAGDDGRVLLTCHTGCSYAAIMTALGLFESDGFPTEPPVTLALAKQGLALAKQGLAPSRRREVAWYDYQDESGQNLYQTVRYEPKDFRQRHANGSGEWIWNLEGIRQILYRLPELLAADPEEPVWLVEGEKDADTLASFGLVATTSAMGAKNWKPAYAEFLRGRSVIVLPDNDGPGRAYAKAIIDSLEGLTESVRILQLPDLPHGGDVSDWLAKGHTRVELVALAIEAEDADDVDLLHRYTVHHASEVFEPIPELEWVIGDLMSRQSVNVLCGPPGSKKTYTAIDMAVCVALGIPWLGRPVVQGPVLIIDEESGNNRLKRRLLGAFKAYGAGHDIPIHWTSLEMFNLRKPGEFEHIEDMFEKYRPVLAIVDALADLMPGADENTVQDTIPIMLGIRDLAERFNCANLLLHHANKMGSYRGSSAISGAVNLMLMIDSAKDSWDVKYTIEKTRDTAYQTFSAKLDMDTVAGTTRLVPMFGENAIRRPLSEQYILDYTADNGGRASMADYRSNASCCSPATAERSVYRLVSDGTLRRVGTGKAGYFVVVGKAAILQKDCNTAMQSEEKMRQMHIS